MFLHGRYAGERRGGAPARNGCGPVSFSAATRTGTAGKVINLILVKHYLQLNNRRQPDLWNWLKLVRCGEFYRCSRRPKTCRALPVAGLGPSGGIKPGT